jgi:hypothetical protein
VLSQCFPSSYAQNNNKCSDLNILFEKKKKENSDSHDPVVPKATEEEDWLLRLVPGHSAIFLLRHLLYTAGH